MAVKCIKRQCVFFLSVVFFFLLLFSFPIPAQPETITRKLVWSDEFNYQGAPDSQKWGYDVGCDGWGNGEMQCYEEKRLENARVENGVLIIEARRDGKGSDKFTSARLTTKGKAAWKYVRIDVRAKLAGGRGAWPAVWMLPQEKIYGKKYWPDNGEIDIVEHVGYQPEWIHGSVHTFVNHGGGPQHEGGKKKVVDAENAFHTYSIDWFEDRIHFLVDNKEYYTIYKKRDNWKYWPFDQEFYLLANIAVGGFWGGQRGIDGEAFPQKMEIDYIRIYQ